MSNTQRITKLSRKEKEAAVSGGALDFRIPEENLRQRLQDEPATFDVDVVLDELAHHLAWARLTSAVAHMKPGKVREQAEHTVAVIDELIMRLDNMHPGIACMVDESLYRIGGEFCVNLRDRMAPDLYRLRSALRSAILTMEAEPVRPGPKGDRSALKATVAEILRANSEPSINAAEANALAADLLELCNLPKRRNT